MGNSIHCTDERRNRFVSKSSGIWSEGGGDDMFLEAGSTSSDGIFNDGLQIGIQRSRIELCGLWSNCGVPTVSRYFTGRVRELDTLERLVNHSLSVIKDATLSPLPEIQQRPPVKSFNNCIGIQGTSGVGKVSRFFWKNYV